MINKVILIGRVGTDPQVKQLSGTSVASITLATSEKYKNKSGEKVENTEWHNLQVWDKLAEVVEKYVKKGQLLYVEGKIKTESWDKDGQKHYKTVILVNSLQMLGGKPNEPAQQKSDWTGQGEDPAGDLPF